MPTRVRPESPGMYGGMAMGRADDQYDGELADMEDPALERAFRGHREGVMCLAFKPSMTQLASGSKDNTVMVWNFKPGMRAFRFVGHKGPVHSVDFAPSGTLLASASKDKTVRLWTPTVNGNVSVFTAHTAAVRVVQFARDGRQMLTCSDDKTVKIWSTHHAKFLHTFTGHSNWVRAASYSPDATLIASASDDRTIKLWESGGAHACVQTYHLPGTGAAATGHPATHATSVAFHPLGGAVATGCADGSVQLWDIRMHRVVQHYPGAHAAGAIASAGAGAGAAGLGGTGPSQPAPRPAAVHSVDFGGAAGEWMVTTGSDGLVRIWDLMEGHLLYTLHGHKESAPTNAAVFSPAADYFATAGDDAQVFLWKSNLTTARNTPIPHENGGTGRMIGEEEPINLGAPLFHSTRKRQPDGKVHARRMSVRDSALPGDGHTAMRTTKLEEKTVPISLALSLETIVSQLDVLTSTMNLLEQRLTTCEDRIGDMHRELHQKKETSAPVPPAAASTPSMAAAAAALAREEAGASHHGDSAAK